MIDRIPAWVWGLLLIATLAYPPAVYVCRHIAHAPSRRDITQPGVDLSWRSGRQLGISLLLLAALVALAVFSLTPWAAQMVRSVVFRILLVCGLGLYVLYTVINGFVSGRISPAIKGVYREFERTSEPRRFWASMGWNALLGCFMLWFGYAMVPKPVEDRCYDRADQYSAQQSLAACNRLIAEHPAADDVVDWVAAQGRAYHLLDDYRRALADYDRALKIDPHQSWIQYNRGLVHDRLGDYRAAAADYSAAIRGDPKNADAYVRRGAIYFDNADFEGAVADFTRAHQLRPKDAEPLSARAQLYAFQGKEALASRDFEAVRAIDPSNFWLAVWDTQRALKSSDWRSAVASLTIMLNRDPGDEWALAMRAEAYRQLGENEKARADDDGVKQLKQGADSAQRKADAVSAP